MTAAHCLRLEAKGTEENGKSAVRRALHVIKTLRFTTPFLIPPPIASSPSAKLLPDPRPISSPILFARCKWTQRTTPTVVVRKDPIEAILATDKLQKFAKWRIDSSSIEFPKDGPEFRGGFATVSRAVLVSTSASKGSADDSAQSGVENESDGGTSGRKAIAVKKLKIENGEDKERVLGLALREAGFLTELSHGNVVKLEGFVEDLSEDRVWLVFPWADNGNLKDFVASANWEIPERIWLIDDVARGVTYLHKQNPPIYHGDLKSANVVVSSEYRAIVTDFGSARRLTKQDPPVRPGKSENEMQAVQSLETEFCEITNTITLKGNQYTLRWAPPELLKDDEPGLWSDIWALGWVFYEPMIIPDRQRAENASVSQTRSARLLIQMGDMHRHQSDHINASKFYTEALGLCMETADNAGKARALQGLADVNRLQNNYTKAAQLYSEVVQLVANIGDRKIRADALWGLAELHRLQKEYKEAVTFYSEIIQISTDLEDRKQRADAMRGLAHVHRLQKEYSKAVSLYSEVAQTCTDIGDRVGRAEALWGLAELHRAQKQYSQAIQLFSEGLQIRIDIGDRHGRAWTLMRLADIHHNQGQHEDAIHLDEQAAGIFEEIGDTQCAAFTSNRAAEARGKLKPAVAAE